MKDKINVTLIPASVCLSESLSAREFVSTVGYPRGRWVTASLVMG